MTNTPTTFPNPEIPTIITDTGVDRPNTDAEMAYLNKKNNYKSICQKLRKTYVYETDMRNIYDIIVGQTNEQLQDKTALDATLQAVNTGQDPIRYLMILKNLCFSNHS